MENGAFHDMCEKPPFAGGTTYHCLLSTRLCEREKPRFSSGPQNRFRDGFSVQGNKLAIAMQGDHFRIHAATTLRHRASVYRWNPYRHFS
jgi:hypothetical protein